MSEDRCPCGGIILADTEDWETPLCHECWVPYTRMDIPKLVRERDGYAATIAAKADMVAEVARLKAKLYRESRMPDGLAYQLSSARVRELEALLREAVGVLEWYADKGKYTPPSNWQYNSDAENYTVLADKGDTARAFLSREDVRSVGAADSPKGRGVGDE